MPHSTGKSCLYIKNLEEVDHDLLERLITDSIKSAGTRISSPSLADRFLSDPDHRSDYHIKIDSTPERVWPHLENLDLARSPLIKFLFTIRGLGKLRTVSQFEQMGFRRLEMSPPDSLVFGLIGQFWKPSGHLVEFEPDEFESFSEPGYAKAVASFELAVVEDATILTTETLIQTTDPTARRSFNRYWRLIGPFSGLIRRSWLRTIKKAAEVQ